MASKLFAIVVSIPMPYVAKRALASTNVFSSMIAVFRTSTVADRRGAPNEVIRSALFGVVQRGRRKRVIDLPVAGPAGSNIAITGWRLDQYDLDIWLEVMHLARNEKPGETVTFSLRSMLKRLHSTVNTGSADLKWIHDRLKKIYRDNDRIR